MADGLFARKRHERLEGRGFTSARSIKKRIESAELPLSDISRPSIPFGVIRHALSAACVVAPLLAIPQVFAMDRKPEIGAPVVAAIPINVVYVVAIRYGSMDEDPGQSVSGSKFSASMKLNVPGVLVDGSALLPHQAGMPWAYRLDARKDSRFMVIRAKLFQFMLADFHLCSYKSATDKGCYV